MWQGTQAGGPVMSTASASTLQAAFPLLPFITLNSQIFIS